MARNRAGRFELSRRRDRPVGKRPASCQIFSSNRPPLASRNRPDRLIGLGAFNFFAAKTLTGRARCKLPKRKGSELQVVNLS
jgi:hypothetical protein